MNPEPIVIQQKSKLSQMKVVVLIPIGIPGFGKTFYCGFLKKYIEQNKIGSFIVISNDKIRKEQMDLLKQKISEPQSQQSLFDQTAKISTQLFRKTLKQVIENLPQIHGDSASAITFIMLDKNHPPNSLDLTQKLLREYCSLHPEILLKIIAVFPVSICPFFRYKLNTTDENNNIQFCSYPFSLNYFLTCLKRVQNRKCHETLIGDHENSALIVLYFIQLFKNANVSKEAIEKYGFDLKLRLPFIYEDSKSNDAFDEVLIEKFKNVLDSIVPFKECNMELLKDFINYFENYNWISKDILEKDLMKGAEYGIQQCIKLFSDYNQSNYQQNLELGQSQSQEMFQEPELQQQQSQVSIPQCEKEQSQQDQIINYSETYKYNPRKIPKSLGICITQDQESKHQLIEFIRSNLQKLIEIMPGMPKLKQEYEKLPAIFQFPKILHLTTLHIENSTNALQTKHYINFHEGIEVKVNLIGILYFPGKIITGLCQLQPLPFNMTIETEFPHLTLMVGETPPKMSTILLNAIFGKGGKYEGEYNDPNGILLRKERIVEKVKIKIQKKYEEAFIVKGENVLELCGRTESWHS